jgi:hypothetical protein
MCDRCLIDFLMYGEPVEHEAPVFEKGRFQAKVVETSSDAEDQDAPSVRRKSPDAPKARRDQE